MDFILYNYLIMDWYTIEYLYPKSFEKFVNTMFPTTGVASTFVLGCFEIKNLYGFFDKEGIFLNVEKLDKYQWIYTISLDKGYIFSSSNHNFMTREETEIDGFTECFRLLDKKLTDSKSKMYL
jgi:hypothetical protein